MPIVAWVSVSDSVRRAQSTPLTEVVAETRHSEPGGQSTRRSIFRGNFLLRGQELESLGPWTVKNDVSTARGRTLLLSIPKRLYRVEDLHGRSASYSIRLGTLDAKPESTYASDAAITGWSGPIALFRANVGRMEVREDGVTRFTKLGLKLPILPELRLKDLDFRTKPTSRGQSTVDNQTLLGDTLDRPPNQAAWAGHRFYAGGGVGIGLQKAWSFDLTVGSSLVPMTGPLDNRLEGSGMRGSFNSSTYSNVRLYSDDRFHERYRVPRAAAYFGFNRNKSYLDQTGRTPYSRPWSISLELGGPIGPTGVLVQLLRERVEVPGFAQTRWGLLGSWSLLHVPAPDGWTLDSRIDGMALVDEDDNYSWLRPMVGVSKHWTKEFRTAAAYHYTARSKTQPAFPMDRVYGGHEVHLRADLSFGHTWIGALNRYNSELGHFYRPQFVVEHPVGVFVPWFRYDGQFGTWGFGFTVRTDGIANLTKSGEIVRFVPGD